MEHWDVLTFLCTRCAISHWENGPRWRGRLGLKPAVGERGGAPVGQSVRGGRRWSPPPFTGRHDALDDEGLVLPAHFDLADIGRLGAVEPRIAQSIPRPELTCADRLPLHRLLLPLERIQKAQF